MNWLEAKLRQIAQRHQHPVPEAAKPKPGPRYKLAAEHKPKALAPPFEPPPGVPASEWAAAQRNVAAGSAPSAIAAGSDIPSDFTMRRNGLHTPR
jgi:hypothetical protein